MIHGGVAAFIKSSLSYETLADQMSGEEQLEFLAFKVYGREANPIRCHSGKPTYTPPPSQSFNLDSILIERRQEVVQTKKPAPYLTPQRTQRQLGRHDDSLSSCNI